MACDAALGAVLVHRTDTLNCSVQISYFCGAAQGPGPLWRGGAMQATQPQGRTGARQTAHPYPAAGRGIAIVPGPGLGNRLGFGI